MSRYSIIIALFLILFPLTHSYSQEEFFGNTDGVSLLYLKGMDAQAIGISGYFEKGFITGMSLNKVEGITVPSLVFLICPDWRNEYKYTKLAFGPSYSYINKVHVFGLHLAISGIFFSTSNFPFSITGSGSTNLPLGIGVSSSSGVIPVFGLGYTQAFFARENVYPYLGISYSHSTEANSYFPFLTVGLNFKLINHQ